MKYLTITNSDGDVLMHLYDEMPDLEGACVYGVDMIEKSADSNYWPENSYVVLEVKESS